MVKQNQLSSRLLLVVLFIAISVVAGYGQALPGEVYKIGGINHWLLQHVVIKDRALQKHVEGYARLLESNKNNCADLSVIPYVPNFLYVQRRGDSYVISCDGMQRLTMEENPEPIGYTAMEHILIVFDQSMNGCVTPVPSSLTQFAYTSNPEIGRNPIREHFLFMSGYSTQDMPTRYVSAMIDLANAVPEITDQFKIWQLKPVRYRSDNSQQIFENFMTLPEYGVVNQFNENDFGYITRVGFGQDYAISIFDETALMYEEINPIGYIKLNGSTIIFDKSVAKDIYIIGGGEITVKVYKNESITDDDLLWIGGDDVFSTSWGVVVQ